MAKTALRPVGTDDGNETAHTVTARRRYSCDDYPCRAVIEPGEEYVRVVCFPGHDANGGTRPWVMRLCRTSATLGGRPMPRRKAASHAR